jgi:hypothetical protein
MITKGERTELRSIVRQQFKVLRHEVEQRQAEMIADLDAQIAQRYADVDKQRQDLMWKAEEICQAASREITDLFKGTGAVKGYADSHVRRAAQEEDIEVTIQRPVRVGMEPITWSKADRVQLRRAAVARIEADVKGALLNLERREADLLRTLAVGAIESEEARAFLEGIPTVAELVPQARLLELEAQFDEGTG